MRHFDLTFQIISQASVELKKFEQVVRSRRRLLFGRWLILEPFILLPLLVDLNSYSLQRAVVDAEDVRMLVGVSLSARCEFSP